jgi:hypothetical protein
MFAGAKATTLLLSWSQDTEVYCLDCDPINQPVHQPWIITIFITVFRFISHLSTTFFTMYQPLFYMNQWFKMV